MLAKFTYTRKEAGNGKKTQIVIRVYICHGVLFRFFPGFTLIGGSLLNESVESADRQRGCGANTEAN